MAGEGFGASGSGFQIARQALKMITGQINEEKMSVYVRLGIRLLYKGLKSNNMENKRSEFLVFQSFFVV